MSQNGEENLKIVKSITINEMVILFTWLPLKSGASQTISDERTDFLAH